MSIKRNPSARYGWRIAGVVVLSLLGLALVPLLALPYDRLDWVAYSPVYCDTGDCVPPASPSPTPQPIDIPCAELPQPDEPLAARVNGQGIGQATFDREMDQFLAAMSASGVDLESEAAASQLPAWRRMVLDLLIDDVLVQQAAVDAALSVSDEQVHLEVTAEISRSGGLAWYQAWLSATAQTPAEHERDVCQDLLAEAVRDWATAAITGTPGTVWARQIVVATAGDAQTALARLESGRPFVAVAQEMSIDTQTREHGGSLGWFVPGTGRTAPEIEAAAVSGALGQIQGPIPVGGRYVIVQTLGHRPDPPSSVEDWESRRSEAFATWLAARRAAAEIEVTVEE